MMTREELLVKSRAWHASRREKDRLQVAAYRQAHLEETRRKARETARTPRGRATRNAWRQKNRSRMNEWQRIHFAELMASASPEEVAAEKERQNAYNRSYYARNRARLLAAARRRYRERKGRASQPAASAEADR